MSSYHAVIHCSCTNIDPGRSYVDTGKYFWCGYSDLGPFGWSGQLGRIDIEECRLHMAAPPIRRAATRVAFGHRIQIR